MTRQPLHQKVAAREDAAIEIVKEGLAPVIFAVSLYALKQCESAC